jgi:hypothetical protein
MELDDREYQYEQNLLSWETHLNTTTNDPFLMHVGNILNEIRLYMIHWLLTTMKVNGRLTDAVDMLQHGI